MHQKLALGPFLIFLYNLKQPLHARNYFKNKIFWKKIFKKLSQKLTLFFLSNLVPLNGQNYQKQKGAGTSDHRSSG